MFIDDKDIKNNFIYWVFYLDMLDIEKEEFISVFFVRIRIF